VRRALAAGILCWVALWPLVHRAVVAAWDVNPWKLGGFAMYTTATPPVQIALLVRGDTGLEPLDERALPDAVRRALHRFRIERHALGALRSPDDVGRAILEARPELPWVVIAIQRMHLDPTTALMQSTREQVVTERHSGG
jgi:hypothetical protein